MILLSIFLLILRIKNVPHSVIHLIHRLEWVIDLALNLYKYTLPQKKYMYTEEIDPQSQNSAEI